uniref:T-complex protein delta SU n=1 Tax=Lotharella vacuolata TaxID=74820 RepID=A0A0H5BHE9_9EUKA|nr:T-complex protein delta SU [Lotharella vacuolata]
MDLKKNKTTIINKEILSIAFVVLSNILKTSLGPNGKKKLIYFHNTKLYITKDSKILLNKMRFNKILYLYLDIFKNNYSPIKDGTISIIIISSFIIKNIQISHNDKILFRQNILAIKLNCKKTLNLIKIISFYNYKNFNSKYLFWWLFCTAKTTLRTKIINNDIFVLTKICLIAAMRTKTKSNMNSIKMVLKPEGTIHETFIDDCIFIQTKYGISDDVYIENARLSSYSMLACNIENVTTTKIYFNNYNLEKFILTEKEILKKKCKNILNNGINFLFTNLLIKNILFEFFTKSFLMFIDNCNQMDVSCLRNFSLIYNNNLFAQSFTQITGSVKLIESITISNYKYIIFEKIFPSSECTIIIRGSTITYIKEISLLIFRVIGNLIYVINDCRFLFSGCSTDFKILNYLINHIKYFQNSDKNKLAIFPLGIEHFLKTLFENSYLNYNSLSIKLLYMNMNYANKTVYDLFYKNFLSCDKIGLCEPSKLKEQIFINSTELVEVISRINFIIFNK